MTDLDCHLPGILAGDPDAFGRWVAGAELVLRVGLRAFAGHVDTEAVLQEALLRVWQVAPRFRPDGRANGLLRLGTRIARNLATDEVRRSRIQAGSFETNPGVEMASVGSDPLLRRAIAECRDELPEKPSAALTARLDAGGAEPDATLAGRLGMRKNTFLQNVTRARRLLQECLSRRGIDLDGFFKR